MGKSDLNDDVKELLAIFLNEIAFVHGLWVNDLSVFQARQYKYFVCWKSCYWSNERVITEVRNI